MAVPYCRNVARTSIFVFVLCVLFFFAFYELHPTVGYKDALFPLLSSIRMETKTCSSELFLFAVLYDASTHAAL